MLVRSRRAPLLAALLLVVAAPARAADPPAEFDPESVLRAAKRAARTIPKQAEALALLVWPANGETPHPLVAALARDELVNFGHHGLGALRAAIQRVEPLYRADVTAALIQARWTTVSGEPEDYLPGLVDAIWYGTAEAQRLAMLEVARFHYPPSVLTSIDAAKAHPELIPVALHVFGIIADPRARFFVREQLLTGEPRHRARAARTLAALGPDGLGVLREIARSGTGEPRRIAVETLLPHSTPDDLTLLHEYVASSSGAPAALVEQVRRRAAELEAELERELDAQSASAPGG
jgi:hypothetical protein